MNNINNDKRDESTDGQILEDTQHQRATMLDNNTNERLNHDTALARIFVSGLSVLCFNPNDGRGEIGFIDEHHEPLIVNIYRNAKCEDLFWSSERDFKHSMEKVGITINTTKPAMCRKYENGDTDDESLSRMPDLAKLHNVRKFDKKPTAPDALSARVDTHDATFYTYKMSENKAFLREKNDPSAPGRVVRYERIGRILGADILSDEPIQIQIKYKEGGEIKTYNVPPLDPRSRYTIVLTTKTHHDGTGHIKFIYKNIIKKPQTHPEYDYEFYPEELLWDYCSANEKATQFACESTGAGEGPLPKLP